MVNYKKILFLLIISLYMTTKAFCACDSYTTLLLHANGADASTSFPDSSNSNHTMTAQGNAQVDTAQFEFGGASALLDGTGDYITALNSADWVLGTGDFTWDFWIRFNAISTFQAVFDRGDSAAWSLQISSSAIRLQLNGAVVKTESWAPSTSTWYHVAVTRSGTNLDYWVNGSKVGTTTTNSTDINDNVNSIAIGASTLGASGVNGWIDEFRASKGIARWTANFTPPTAEYCAATTNDKMFMVFE